jgi:hypothetical protein
MRAPSRSKLDYFANFAENRPVQISREIGKRYPEFYSDSTWKNDPNVGSGGAAITPAKPNGTWNLPWYGVL